MERLSFLKVPPPSRPRRDAGRRRVLRRRQEEHGGQAERALNQLRGRFHFVDDGEGERGENANEPPTTRLVQNDSL